VDSADEPLIWVADYVAGSVFSSSSMEDVAITMNNVIES